MVDGGERSRDELVVEALGRPLYHTIELSKGVTTPGSVDLRRVARRVLPDVRGRRCLDVGTFDGFWAIEMARGGAAATYALDLERYEDLDVVRASRKRLEPTWDGFPGERVKLALAITAAKVQLVRGTVYGLNAGQLDGQVDIAMLGALLLHLRDPLTALENVHDVIVPGGQLCLVEPFDMPLSIIQRKRPVAAWRGGSDYDLWVANSACLFSWLELAGFVNARRKHVFRGRSGHLAQWHMCVMAERPE